ncbi:MAG: RdgB/HAM1 family non-canonical purine NTP pyrophosphatase [Bacteroidetes bacterium]|nr:RdgB/HAM1 family non-canonical purine NTP pyrophosphatase [Bacteroidota bacterium]
MNELIFATQNKNKVNEIALIVPENTNVISLLDLGYEKELDEDFETLEENSSQKAKFVFDLFGKNCFSEDTGLEIDALGGAPGVYSARYAGEEKDMQKNMDKVLLQLGDSKDRKARFKTVITSVTSEEIIQFVGLLEGEIGKEKKGINGFGYDPIFYLPNGQALAEINKEEKSKISHRGIAFKKLISHLKK